MDKKLLSHLGGGGGEGGFSESVKKRKFVTKVFFSDNVANGVLKFVKNDIC